jgi:hypothetical protein
MLPPSLLAAVWPAEDHPDNQVVGEVLEVVLDPRRHEQPVTGAEALPIRADDERSLSLTTKKSSGINGRDEAWSPPPDTVGREPGGLGGIRRKRPVRPEFFSPKPEGFIVWDEPGDGDVLALTTFSAPGAATGGFMVRGNAGPRNQGTPSNRQGLPCGRRCDSEKPGRRW